MLDDTHVDNGAMFVIPGTHRGEIFNHHGPDGYFCGAIDPETAALDFNQAVACEGPAGSVTFHHARTVHGVRPKHLRSCAWFIALRDDGGRRLSLAF